MGKVYTEIDVPLREWLSKQKIFFVSTAPLSQKGLINCSPKGMDTFRVLGPKTIAYLDLTGSGVETIAHLKESGRIVIMFCAFDGPPKIYRFHGIGKVIEPGDARFEQQAQFFQIVSGARSIIEIEICRISDSCGYAVPLYEFKGYRDTLAKWAETKGVEGLKKYREEKNFKSIDGLPGLKNVERPTAS